jgi:hypothetical protein
MIHYYICLLYVEKYVEKLQNHLQSKMDEVNTNLVEVPFNPIELTVSVICH